MSETKHIFTDEQIEQAIDSRVGMSDAMKATMKRKAIISREPGARFVVCAWWKELQAPTHEKPSAILKQLVVR